MPDIPAIFGRKRPAQSVGGSAHLRDHSAAYRRQRAALLDAEPLCRYCRSRGHSTPATVVDHIVALSCGGDNSGGYMAPACHTCYAEKGRLEARFAQRGYDPRDIMCEPELADWIRRGLQWPLRTMGRG